MHFSNNEIATYLFCAPLPSTKTTALTIIEWNVIVKSLTQHQLNPEFLLNCSMNDLLEILKEATTSQKNKIIQKVENRQKLGIALVELEEAINQGYSVAFRGNMPKRLKKLKLDQRPAFYYYIGDINILNCQNALSVVGSRDASSDELEKVTLLCEEAAAQNIVVISGGAKGIDITATDASLKAGGKAVIFPSNGLATWVKNKENRKYIQNGQLLIMSTQHLNASFSGFYAMQRNKFIHSTGDATLVGSSQISGAKKSGTWEGVKENLKEKWSPLYVIGTSIGVQELLNNKQAEQYSTINEIFFSSQKMAKIFGAQLEMLFNHALKAGLNEELIKVTVSEEIEKLIIKLQQTKSAKQIFVNENSNDELKQMDIFDTRL